MTEGQYSNLCFIEKNNGDIVENGCTAFIAAQDGSYFFTNSIGAVGNTYYAELSYGMQFVKKGKVSIYLKINFLNFIIIIVFVILIWVFLLDKF